MDRDAVRQAWESVSETYARTRDPTGSDAALVSELVAFLPENPVVLDVGCGDGARTLANLPPGSLGLDFSRRGLELASEVVPDAGLVLADMRSIPVRDETVDAITAYHAVFHVPREAHPAVYHEFARVLKPDGVLLMTLPGGRFETVRRGWMGGQMFFSSAGREQTLSQLADAGFDRLETRVADDPLGTTSEFVFARRATDDEPLTESTASDEPMASDESTSSSKLM
ncbi:MULTISPECIES: class I SAM-dependent methyltransferase [Haloferax]|uniref:Methyltransferase domain-containing protein n=1 Tax=Haloferax marinum TaxID=2666143 RepID=A0A6A8G506_9EURY|nr:MULTISPECIES: class I SAM-dependent methyltransferase [Haloferax]KAB1197148.1 class I SAM-dependent methyltransferase [Haloferax sp. CBA1150]MRW96181.1 methyltransferase domain-containing protein [Haloferax marinum]